MAFLCQRYKVSRSGFYAWEARERSRRSRDDEELGAEIARIHRDSRGTYGSPRIHEQLKRMGTLGYIIRGFTVVQPSIS